MMIHTKATKKYLLKFLTAYIQWIEDGADKHRKFTKRYGICGNFSSYFHGQDRIHYAGTYLALKHYLPKSHWTSYPFNNRDFIAFHRECEEHRCHLNHERLTWVYMTINQLKKELKDA